MRSPEFRAVWLARSRAVSAKLRFWLLIAGLDQRPRRFNDRLYLVYVIAFFALWAFSLLTLLAGFGADLLAILPMDPAQATVALASLGLLAWTLAVAWRASRRSPLVFSDADAQLLCQTPVPRSHVALTWLLTDWPLATLPVLAVAAILGYAQVEIALGESLAIDDLPRYLAAGLRAVGAVLPLHLGLMALAWSPGVYRLQGGHERRWVHLLPAAVALTALAALVAAGPRQLLDATTGMSLLLPLRAAFGDASWLAGTAAGLVLAAAGLLLLHVVARGLSLSRAAQETRGLEAMRTAQLAGAGQWAAEQARQRRLGSGRRPSRLPARPGAGALPWKRAIQWRRGLTLGAFLTALAPALAAVGMAVAPDPGTRLWSTLLWLYLGVQACSGPLRQELGRWWLLRGLPFSTSSALAAVMAVPTAIFLAASLPAGVLGLVADGPAGALVAALLAPASVIVAAATAIDIGRRAQASALMAGVVPGAGSVALLIAAAALLPPLGLAWWLWPVGHLPAIAAATVCALAVAALTGWAAVGSLRRVA